MSENKRDIALVHEICPICGKPMNEQILMNTVFSKKYAKEIENVHGKAIGYSKTACEDCSKYKDEAVMCIAIDEAKKVLKLKSKSLYIMAIDCENDDLIRLSNLYDIDWKINNTFKDKNIKDITVKDITVKDYNNYIKSISIVSNL